MIVATSQYNISGLSTYFVRLPRSLGCALCSESYFKVTVALGVPGSIPGLGQNIEPEFYTVQKFLVLVRNLKVGGLVPRASVGTTLISIQPCHGGVLSKYEDQGIERLVWVQFLHPYKIKQIFVSGLDVSGSFIMLSHFVIYLTKVPAKHSASVLG